MNVNQIDEGSLRPFQICFFESSESFTQQNTMDSKV